MGFSWPVLSSRSSRPMPKKVRVHELRKRYGGVAAADGVSFEIGAGEIFALIGPNGAGKTTTLECVIGLREPDAGEIEVCGIDARRRPQEVKQKIGAALQTSVLQDRITPREALTLFGAFYRERQSAEALLERFALGSKRTRRSSHCREGRSSGSPWRWPSSTSPSSSSSMNPRPASIPNRAASCTMRSGR